MGSKVIVNFDKDLYRLLGCVSEGGEPLDYPEWDLLKELDRRKKRKGRSRSRIQMVRKWMREHPDEVEEIKGRSNYGS